MTQQKATGQEITEPEIEFDPREPVFPTMTAQEALNEALEHLMGEATGEGPQGDYPADDELDAIAPSLKGLVMREIREQQLAPCNHAFSQLADLGYDIAHGLPEQELNALLERMKPTGNG